MERAAPYDRHTFGIACDVEQPTAGIPRQRWLTHFHFLGKVRRFVKNAFRLDFFELRRVLPGAVGVQPGPHMLWIEYASREITSKGMR